MKLNDLYDKENKEFLEKNRVKLTQEEIDKAFSKIQEAVDNSVNSENFIIIDSLTALKI